MNKYELRISNIINDITLKHPLVHHITNYVSANDCANVVLAMGGSPVMADEEEEVGDIVKNADALVINLGTLNTRTFQSMLKAGCIANECGVPVILDPVGVGATFFRKKAAEELLKNVKVAVVRGNVSEINILSGISVNMRGVDSEESDVSNIKEAMSLASDLNCIVAMTGKRDFITDGILKIWINNGHEMLKKVTGTGCMTTSIIATLMGVTCEYIYAAIAGISIMGLAGEYAYMNLLDTQGIGSFRVSLIDYISNIKPRYIIEGGRMRVE